MRINKYISLSGFASRRAADELVASGRVQVNGETISDLGHQVDETKDQVTVDGDRKSTRLNSSHIATSRMPSSA